MTKTRNSSPSLPRRLLIETTKCIELPLLNFVSSLDIRLFEIGRRFLPPSDKTCATITTITRANLILSSQPADSMTFSRRNPRPSKSPSSASPPRSRTTASSASAAPPRPATSTSSSPSRNGPSLKRYVVNDEIK